MSTNTLKLAAVAGTDRARPGRSCPLHYRHSPKSLDRPPELLAPALYVVGGLYGNPYALDALHRLVEREDEPAKVVFNGDFNWFNVDPHLFESINQCVLAQHATAGNVELEVASPSADAGCGCAYPEWVDDEVVHRSNAIASRLRDVVAQGNPEIRARLAALPLNMVAQVGAARIGIVHGDAQALAGWGFSREALAGRGGMRRAAGWLEDARVDVFTCSHTCEPLCRPLTLGATRGVVINNGAAGMPNLAGRLHGIVTRVATTPCAWPERLYGTRVSDVYVDALALHYDTGAWWSCFRAMWPEGSEADLNYTRRIREGTRLSLATVSRDCATASD